MFFDGCLNILRIYLYVVLLFFCNGCSSTNCDAPGSSLADGLSLVRGSLDIKDPPREISQVYVIDWDLLEL